MSLRRQDVAQITTFLCEYETKSSLCALQIHRRFLYRPNKLKIHLQHLVFLFFSFSLLVRFFKTVETNYIFLTIKHANIISKLFQQPSSLAVHLIYTQQNTYTSINIHIDCWRKQRKNNKFLTYQLTACAPIVKKLDKNQLV